LKNRKGHAVRGLFYFCSLLLQMKKKTGFEKFHKVKSGSALKEQIRQEKKKITKERKEFFEAKRQEEYRKKSGIQNHEPGIKRTAADSRSQTATASQMPLNKYIAHSGVCSRRDAAELIKSGKVKLNGEVVTEPGRKVLEKDVVIVGNKRVYPVEDLVYILLNKPKDYLTTTDDPQQRKTVLDLIVGATKGRVYPVGRLDRNTSGVLLLTNDGELAQKLTHPSNEIKKVYAVTLNKALEKKHFDEILKGVELEDGMAHVDVLAYTDIQDKTQIGVEIHSGRNRIVRRIFEKFGYDVKGLDRVMFAGLTKKNVNRGKWRYLNEKEVRDLKYFKKGK
jgi:23S rRNA pseudouridine2605 synthase